MQKRPTKGRARGAQEGGGATWDWLGQTLHKLIFNAARHRQTAQRVATAVAKLLIEYYAYAALDAGRKSSARKKHREEEHDKGNGQEGEKV